MGDEKKVKLVGKLKIACEIETKTGMHIGGLSGGLEIGGVDSPVIRDPVTKVPYIPGSSLKGKMRSLLEKSLNLPQNKRVHNSNIHECKESKDYEKCDVCKIFGTSGIENNERFGLPTRLIVRDAMMTEDSRKKLLEAQTDLPYTEVKFEATIDRITSAATPRQIERVPAGTTFDLEMIYNVFTFKDDKIKLEDEIKMFSRVIEGLNLIQDDALGGSGSRGYGKVEFKDINIDWYPIEYYEGKEDKHQSLAKDKKVSEIKIENLINEIKNIKG